MAENSFTNITPADLQDPTLFRLNSIISFIAAQVSLVQGGNGPYRFPVQITAPSFIGENTEVPTNPQALLTRGAADKLYSPSALEQALSTGRFQGNPIGGGGIGPGGGSGGGSGSTTRIQVSYGQFYANSVQRQLNVKLGDQVSVLDFGATGDGQTDDTAAFQKALEAVQDAGRSTEILVPAGVYRVRQITTAPNTPQVRFKGQGEGSVIQFWTRYNTATETWDVPAGQGRVFIQSSDVAFVDIVLDGNQTVPVQFSFDAIPNGDMLSDVVTDRSMVWVKPTSGSTISNIHFAGVIFRNVLGHGVILDTSLGQIRDVCVQTSTFTQIRSGLFGLTTSTSVVNRNGAAVTLASGSAFVPAMAGQYVVIGTRAYLVDRVNSGSSLTLANDEAGNPPLGTQTAVTMWWGSDMQYGGPMACIYYRGNGQAQGDPMVSNLVVANNHFDRMNGECVKGDALGINALHSGVSVTGNAFTDIGFGAVCPGYTAGLAVVGNCGRRIGYVTSSDTAAPVPRFLPDHSAAVMRFYGLVTNFAVSGNSFLNHNGNGLWLTGGSDGVCSGNGVAISNVGSPLYNEDSVGGYGTVGNNLSTGIYIDNYYQQEGAARVVVSGNQVTNTGLGCIILRNARYCSIKGNVLSLGATAIEIPILVVNYKGIVNGVLQSYAQWQASNNHRSYDNEICENTLFMQNNLKVGVQEVVLNDPTTGLPFDWQATDQNRVWDNRMLGINRGEFIKSSTSDSYVGASWSTPDPAATGISRLDILRDGFGSTARTVFRVNEVGTLREIMQLLDESPKLLVGEAAGEGYIATGNRDSLSFNDLVGSGKVYSDGFLWLRADTYSAAEANSLDDTQGLIAWDAVNKKLIGSEATSSGERVWQPLLGQSTSPGGANGAVQYNNGGAFGGSADFTFDAAARMVTIQGNLNVLPQAGDATEISVIIRATAGQTGNLTEWRDEAGNSLVAIAPNGGLYFRTSSLVSAGGVGVIGYNQGSGKMQVSNNGGAFQDIVIGDTIKSLNGLTNPALSIIAGPGITVSTSGTDKIQISGGGVTAFNGATGAITLTTDGPPNGINISSVGPSSFNLSLPQALGTTGNVVFNSLVLNDTIFGMFMRGSIIVVPGDSSVGYYMNGTKVIDNTGRFVGNSVFTPGSVTAGSVIAPQYFSNASGTAVAGRTAVITIGSTTLTFSGGILI